MIPISGRPISVLTQPGSLFPVVRREKRISEDDEYFRKLSSAWSDELRSAFAKIEELKL